jgi:tRNA(Ile)-lysidine synthase
MANLKLPPQSKFPLLNDVFHALESAFSLTLQENKDNTKPHIVLAFSGGLDSSVLLHLLVQCQLTIPFHLSAIHVHHGLSPNADAWARFCETTCANYHVPFELRRINFKKSTGLGIEAAAREARYELLDNASADWICLAHHENDQAETLLLQLARGAGVKGLSAMATIDKQQKRLRPLIASARQALEEYANQHQLQWVNDESNHSLDYDRNFMRHQVLPVLQSRYPSIYKTISRSASHMAEAGQLLLELAEIDAKNTLHQQDVEWLLDVKQLALLSEPRGKNVLRYWLQLYTKSFSQLRMPNALHLNQLWQQLLNVKTDTALKIKVAPNLTVQKYQNHAFLVAEKVGLVDYGFLWQGESMLQLTSAHLLRFSKKLGQGISLKRISNAPLYIKNREGGERIRPQLGRPSRSMKQLLQSHHIPPWQRKYWPMVFFDETLVCVPNLVVDCDWQASPDELGLEITCHSV